MALQVWLPLNGNLKNQGLNNVTVINNGTTINDNGKIGKCYNFIISQYLEITNLSFRLLSNCSLCFWLKYDNEQRWLPFSGQGEAYYILAEQSYTTNFYHHNIGSNTIKIYVHGILSTAPPNDGQWHHYCITGADLTSWTKFYINRYTSTSSSFNLEGQYNDIRIYDHCLSPKEVKEISKGLVVHYLMNQETKYTNLIKNGWGGTDNWPNSSSYISTDVPSSPPGITNSYSIVTAKEYIPLIQNHSYTISGYVKKGTSSQSTCYLALIPYDADKLRITYEKTAHGFKTSSLTTLSQDLKSGDNTIYLTSSNGWENPTTYQYVVAIFGYKDSTGYEYPDLIYTRRTFSFGTTSDKSNLDLVNKTITLNSTYSGETIPAGTGICLTGYGGTYYYPAYKSNPSEWELLTNTFIPEKVGYLKAAKYIQVISSLYSGQWTAGLTLIDNSLPNNIIDCSGYCNNGTINKNYTLTTNNKSPRYIVGTNVENGFTISHSNVLNSNNQEWTCCCWIKLNSLTSCYLNNFNVGNKIIHSLSGDQANYSLLYLNSDEHDYYSYSNLGLEENTWYHIAFVFKNSEGLKKIYINGEDHTEIGLNRDSTPLGFQNTITLFQNFNGVASDYREYCTALSSEDILDLYNTSAYIYNNQTLATYQFVEESTTPQSFKTGVFKSNTFLEGELSEDFEHSTNVEIINGETWLKLLHHNNPAVNLFTSSNCWNYNSDNLFSNLDLLRSDNLLNNLSEYEFLVKEKLESSSTEVQIRWKQTNNPATTTTATGYTLIQGNPTHLSPGLVLSGGTHGCIDIYGSDWWCCCGCYTAYQGGIPGFMDVIKSGYLDLYIKINNSVILNKTQTAFYSNKVETNQLIEI